MRTEMQDTCIREKEKIQQEMNDQLGAMRTQLQQNHETDNSHQKLQKQEAGNDAAVRQGDSTAQPEDGEPVQQQQLPLGQRYRKSRFSNNQPRRSQLSDSRLHGRQQETLTYHSKEARGDNSRNELVGHRGNDEVIYSKQTGTRRRLQVNISSEANEISGIARRQRQLNQENENGEDLQKGEQEKTVGTEQSMVANGESAPDAEDPDPGQNSELPEGKRLK